MESPDGSAPTEPSEVADQPIGVMAPSSLLTSILSLSPQNQLPDPSFMHLTRIPCLNPNSLGILAAPYGLVPGEHLEYQQSACLSTFSPPSTQPPENVNNHITRHHHFLPTSTTAQFTYHLCPSPSSDLKPLQDLFILISVFTF